MKLGRTYTWLGIPALAAVRALKPGPGPAREDDQRTITIYEMVERELVLLIALARNEIELAEHVAASLRPLVRGVQHRIDTELGPVRFPRLNRDELFEDAPTWQAVYDNAGHRSAALRVMLDRGEQSLWLMVQMELPSVDEWAAWWNAHGTRLI